MEFKLLSEVNYEMENGNYVNLPHDLLEKLNSESKELPYFFEICTQSFLKSYVGVKQFTADKDTIQLPLWLSNSIGIEGNQIVTITLIENVPKGKYVKLRPESEDFFNVPDYESCLETKLSDFPLLYQSQIIQLDIFDKKYDIKVEEIEQDWEKFNFEKGTMSLELNVIDVINTDINVDINNMFLRKRLEEQALAEQKRIEEERIRREKEMQERVLQKAKQEKVEEPKKSFQGEGRRLEGYDNPRLSDQEVREARMRFFRNKMNNTTTDSPKVEKKLDKNVDV